MEKKRLIELLETQGYFGIVTVPERGLCGLFKFMFTVGLCVDLDLEGCKGRYCYPDIVTAACGLADWDGQGDPPDEDWIKHKGGPEGEYSNPKKPKPVGEDDCR